MKKYLFITCITVIFSCNNNTSSANLDKTTNETSNETLTLEGAWELESFLNYRSDGVADTIKTSNTFKQMKMFSKSKIMWSRLRTGDSLDWFGVGDYTFEDGILTENLEYGSKAMRYRIATNKVFDFEILINENSFTQIEKDSLGRPIYAENYIRAK